MILLCKRVGLLRVKIFSITVALGFSLLGMLGLAGHLPVVAHNPVSETTRGTTDDSVIRMTWPQVVLTDYLAYLPIVHIDYDYTPSIFSLQMYGAINAANGFTYVLDSGAMWIRRPIYWYNIEPANTTPDLYNWSDLDTTMQALRDANIHIIATIEGNPAWAAAHPFGPVYNIADFQEYIGALVARYPWIEYWEIYNEPDNKDFFGLQSTTYAAMLNAIYPVVKSVNSSAKVVLGGLALDWFTDEGGPFVRTFLQDVLTHCTSPCFDIVNFHYFPAFRYTWEPYGRDIIGKATYVRQVLAAHGYVRPVISTETTWPSATVWGSPALQMKYVLKVYVRSFAAGLRITSWFALRDADSSGPGLLQDPGPTPRPAYTVYKTLTTRLAQARFVRAIPTSETESDRIEGYQFSAPKAGGRKRLDVYWYDCLSMSSVGLPSDCSNSASLTINDSHVALIDMTGATTVLNDGDDLQVDGKIVIPVVNSNPIYIDYEP